MEAWPAGFRSLFPGSWCGREQTPRPTSQGRGAAAQMQAGVAEVPQGGRLVLHGCLPTLPSGHHGSALLLGICKAQVGPTCQEAATQHGVAQSLGRSKATSTARPLLAWQPQAEAISARQPVVSHGSDKCLKCCGQGSSCPTSRLYSS